ncbi:MAG: response regulator [Candidatus Nealsonbacteria bacterium]|nr:response regulator [Candidatus Nealsonbacteria bacterium]
MYRILLVEDDLAIRELVEYNLSREGYRVSSVWSGEDAMAVVQLRSFDLVILDRMLPGVDGLLVCRELRSHAATRSVPIIFLTALGEESDEINGLREGADDYLTKPFSPKVLVARVEAALRRKQEGY